MSPATTVTLPQGASIAQTELDRIQKALDDLSGDTHAAHQLTVTVTLHVYNEYPKHVTVSRVVYKHPKEPFYKVEHRNNLREVVQTEMVPSEHKTLVVANKKEMEKAEKDGWVLEPYIAPPLPEVNADLY
jgi:hypothetical protein